MHHTKIQVNGPSGHCSQLDFHSNVILIRPHAKFHPHAKCHPYGILNHVILLPDEGILITTIQEYFKAVKKFWSSSCGLDKRQSQRVQSEFCKLSCLMRKRKGASMDYFCFDFLALLSPDRSKRTFSKLDLHWKRNTFLNLLAPVWISLNNQYLLHSKNISSEEKHLLCCSWSKGCLRTTAI